MTDMRDELLERVVSELQTLPPVDEAAVGRIVQAVSGRAEAASSGQLAAALPRPGRAEARRWWRVQVPLAAAAGLAIAAGLGGFLAGGAARVRPTATSVVVGRPAPESVRFAAASLPVARPPLPALVPTQFVLDAPHASRVALVGDFNAWNPSATPLTRDPSSRIWTTTVLLPPGRHVYAFMVDGSAWTLDPRAPTAKDPDFGTPSSVVLVGTP